MFVRAQPPTLTEKVKEVFGVSEVPNPEGTTFGPNEVWHIAWGVMKGDWARITCIPVLAHARVSKQTHALGTDRICRLYLVDAGERWFHQRHLRIRQR